MRIIVALLIAALVPTAAAGQAFGVEQGATVSKYGGTPVGGTSFYFRINVPTPNSEFESYAAIATPNSGICKVSGIGRTHTNDDYGSEVSTAFRNLSDALAAKYGKPSEYNYLHSGALWSQPREWVWSIYKKERTLAAYWTREMGSSLPPNVQAIKLEANSVSPTEGAYLTLQYEFSNFNTCKALLSRNDSSGL